jgi:outer membrane protein TolC
MLAGCTSTELHAAGKATSPAEMPDSTTPAQPPGAPDKETFSIDLPTALKLADAQNYKIAIAREMINEAQADYDAAHLLLLPTLNPGLSYHYHRGQLQETNGNMLEVNRASGFAGLGAGAVGAGAVTPPGVSIVADLASVLFEPLAARQNRKMAKSRAESVKNHVLSDVALAYYDLVNAKALLAIAQETAKNTADLDQLTEHFAETGVGLQSDAKRVDVQKILRQKDLRQTREEVQVHSAILAGLLHMDATVVLDPADTSVVPVIMVMHEDQLSTLIATAQTNNPAILQQKAQTAYGQQRYRQAKYRPWLPSFALNASVGAFRGEDGGHTLEEGGSRVDYNAQIYWELDFNQFINARRQRSRYRQAQLEQEGLKKDLAAIVVQAYRQVESAKDQITLTAPAVERAQQSLQLNRNRIFDKQGLPIEVLQAIDSLAEARKAYLDAVVKHNQAQFRLYTAIGQPPTKVNAQK